MVRNRDHLALGGVWDTGLLEHINGNAVALAAGLEQRINPHDRVEWVRGGIEDGVLEGYFAARNVAYGEFSSENPAIISAEHERHADPVIELQLEKAGVRLAYLIEREPAMNYMCFEIVPHPRCRGDWFLKPSWGAPCGLWYRDRQFAISYAEWLAREVENVEIRVYNRDGSLAESRVIRRAGPPKRSN